MVNLFGMPTMSAAIDLGGQQLALLQPRLSPTMSVTEITNSEVVRLFSVAQWRRNRSSKSERVPGATRGEDCVTWSEGQVPTAVIPEASSLITASERPTVWLYLPYAAPNAVRLKFELWDKETQERLEETLVYQLNGSPKFVRFQLPSLVANKSYEWSFLEVCDDNGTSKKKLLFYGEIERIPVDRPLPPLPDSLSDYRERELWLDALNGIAELRMNNRDQPAWSQLLEEIDLDEIASAPFADSVDPQ